MLLSITSAFLSGLIFNFIFFKYSYLGWELQEFCLAQSPDGQWQTYYQALVCGKKLDAEGLKSLWSTLGLIHIFVISGAHLNSLNACFKLMPLKLMPLPARVAILFLYTGCCAFQPPVLRAWLQLLFKIYGKRLYLFYTHHDYLLLSIIFYLGLNPESIGSYGILLSWAASLGVVSGKDILSKSLCCYLFLFPILLNFSPLSPVTILVNTYLTPVIAGILFPLSLLSFISSGVQVIADLLWSLLIETGLWIHNRVPFTQIDQTRISLPALWIYCLCLHTITSHMKRRRI